MAQEEFIDGPLPEIVEQWRAYLSCLDVRSGDLVLDVGCHTGDTERLLLRETGAARVVGLDTNAERVERAGQRLAAEFSPDRFEFVVGHATRLPFPDATFDRLVCAETLEWVREPERAFAEFRRVLKPGGIAVVEHSDFDTQVFNAEDRDLSRRILLGFSDAGPNGQIGRELPGLARAAGFTEVQPRVVPLVITRWADDSYATLVARMIGEWVVGAGLVQDDDVQRWLDDLQHRDGDGSFFYFVARVLCRCTRD